jgi:hypothetical protein
MQLRKGDRTEWWTVVGDPYVISAEHLEVHRRYDPMIMEGDIVAPVQWSDGGRSDRVWSGDNRYFQIPMKEVASDEQAEPTS